MQTTSDLRKQAQWLLDQLPVEALQAVVNLLVVFSGSFSDRAFKRQNGSENLYALEEDTTRSTFSVSEVVADLDPWTQSLVGVVQLPPGDSSTESYIDYLEEKYR